MTRILFIGDLRPHSRSAQRLSALRGAGHEVRAISTVQIDLPPPDGRPARLSDRVRHRLGVPSDRLKASHQLVRAVSLDPRYDLLWVEKALCLRPWALRRARVSEPDLRVVFFSEDDMLPRANGSLWFRRALPLYDVVLTTKSFNARPEELPSLGARRVEALHKSFDPDVYRPLEVTDEDRERLGARVGFIGTYERERAASLLTLARAGIEVRVFGNGWERLDERHPGLRVERRPVYGDDYVRAVCATDVNLGFLRRANRDQHTDRSVEIPACGGFLLAERSDEHSALFKEGREAEFFASDGELVEKVRRYLDEPERRANVAAAGRARCLAGGYRHVDWLARALALVGCPVPMERAA
ncbi:MAG: glycosyltransferase [Planctomycetota bacterium]